MGNDSRQSRSVSERTCDVLQAIAEGCSYEQILQRHPSLTYVDIFRAASEALDVLQGVERPAYSVADIRQRHPRAYEKWTPEEEIQLRQLISQGETVARIARRLERDRGAIRARIVRLGLLDQLSEKEQGRLTRLEPRQGLRP